MGSGGGPPLIFRQWAFAVEQVQEYVASFQAAYEEQVDHAVVSGDYLGIVENFYLTRTPLDMNYGHYVMARRWYTAGWVHDMERYWNLDGVRERIYGNVLDALTIDGKLIAFPYFSTIAHSLLQNDLLTSEAGIDGYPTTFDELYEQCRAIKQAGVSSSPYLPQWFQSTVGGIGIANSLIGEAQARGIEMFDEQYNAVFDENSDLVGLLEEWQMLVQDGLAPEAVLTMSEGDHIAAWQGGNYAYSPQYAYDNKVHNDPSKSQIAGHSRYVPNGEFSWGHHHGAGYFLPRRNDHGDELLARQLRLASYFGFEDEEGELQVPKTWVVDFAFNPVSPSLLEDPEVLASYEQWLPEPDEQFDVLTKNIGEAPFIPVWHSFWYNEFATALYDVLPKAILQEVSATEAVQQMRSLADELQDRYADQQAGADQ